MQLGELTFEAVDDLVTAHARGRLGQPSNAKGFVVSSVAPLIELVFSDREHGGALTTSAWLDPHSQADLRAALRNTHNLWMDTSNRRGFMRTVFDPMNPKDDVPRTSFLLATRKAAEAVGLSVTAAQFLTAALMEMESNILEHAERPQSGLLAFQASNGVFDFVAADSGVGILATIRDASEFRNLTDHGRALHIALQEGVSRHGRDPNHGNGFRDLFRGLSGINADLRFRSGDHALTITGLQPDLKQARLAQKTHFQGFLASVRCRAARSSIAHH